MNRRRSNRVQCETPPRSLQEIPDAVSSETTSLVSLKRNVATLTSINNRNRKEISTLKSELDATRAQLQTQIELKASMVRSSSNNNAKAEETRPAVLPIETQKTSPVKTKLLDMEQRTINLSKNNERLVEQIKRYQDKNDETTARLNELKKNYALVLEANETLKKSSDTAKDLQFQVDSLTNCLKKITLEQDQSQQIVRKQQREASDQSERLEELKQQLEKERLCFEMEKGRLVNQLESKIKEISSLSQVTIAKDASSLLEQEKRKDIEQEKQKLIEKLAEASAENEKLRKLNTEMYSDVNALSTSLKRRGDQLTNLQKTLTKSQDETARAMQQLTDEQELRVKEETEKEKLQSQVNLMRHSSDASVQALQRARTGQDEALSILVKEKQDALQMFMEEATKATGLQKLLKQTQDSLERMRIDKDLLASKLIDQHDLAEQQVKELKSRLDSLERMRIDDQQNRETETKQQLESQLTEIEQLRSKIQALEACKISPETIALLRSTHQELQLAVNKIQQSESAAEATFTCMCCMSIYRQAVTMVPCGHTFCANCIRPEEPCQECKEVCPSSFSNRALEDLAARHLFRQQALTALTQMCVKLQVAFQH